MSMDKMDEGIDGGSKDLMLAPFICKTYDMVDDVLTDDIVSWSPGSDNSFVISKPSEFCSHLLPKYFKHKNFSSFIKQLNIHGFRKNHLERWEFSNNGFVRAQKHLLNNIIRQKPSNSSSYFVTEIAENKDDYGSQRHVVDKKAMKRSFEQLKEEVDDCKNMFSRPVERYTPGVVKDTEKIMSQLLQMEAASVMETSGSTSYNSSFADNVGMSIQSSSSGSSKVLPKHLFDTAVSSYNPQILEDEISVPAYDYTRLYTTKSGDVASTSIPPLKTDASTSIPHQPTDLYYSNLLLSNKNDAFSGDVLVENSTPMPSISVEENENWENNLYMKNLIDKMDQLSKKS